MTRAEQRYEHFRHTRVGRVVTHPLALFASSLLSVLALVVALYVLYSQGQSSHHTAQIARTEARTAVQKAESVQQQSEKAREAAGKAVAASAEQTREKLCALIKVQSSTVPAPTTQRGYAQVEAWAELGKSPLFHCGS